MNQAQRISLVLRETFKRERLKALRRSNFLRFLSRTMVNTIKIPVQSAVFIGKTELLPNTEKYHVFQGIPYAKPPVGPLRFEPAVPVELKGQFDCTREGDVGYQPDLATKIPIGGEDCLYLNVYTPSVSRAAKLPVMVFVHGGAFMMESGGTEWRSPEYLVQEGVIVVTLNYRLGFFGFLHLPKGGIHGNQGLKDQRLALKWVKENIESFGGDSGNITAFGHSAGGASIHIHSLFSKHHEYFHKMIMQSGISTMDWVVQHHAEAKTRRLAKLCGCRSKDDREIVDYLRKVSPLKMLMNLLGTLTPADKKRGLPIIFKPVIEEEGPHALLTQNVIERLTEPNRIDIPTIIGVTQEDGMVMVHGQRNKLDFWDKEPGRFIPRTVNINGDDDDICRSLGDKIKQYYIGTEPVAKSIPQFMDFMGDYNFHIATQAATELHSRFQHPNTNLYYYQFSYDGELNMMKKILGLNYPGANHGDEMTYLFVMKSAEVKVDPDSEAAKMRRKMCKMWTNFAKFSNPTPDPNEVQWRPVKKHRNGEKFDLDMFEIDTTCRMIKNPVEERMNFWRDVFQQYNGGFLKPKL